jgi:hypothetical protein
MPTTNTVVTDNNISTYGASAASLAQTSANTLADANSYTDGFSTLVTLTNKSWFITDIDDATSGVTLQGAAADIAWLSGTTGWNNALYDVTQDTFDSVLFTYYTDISISGDDVILIYGVDSNYAAVIALGIASGDTVRPNYFYSGLTITHNLNSQYVNFIVYDGDTNLTSDTFINDSLRFTAIDANNMMFSGSLADTLLFATKYYVRFTK